MIPALTSAVVSRNERPAEFSGNANAYRKIEAKLTQNARVEAAEQHSRQSTDCRYVWTTRQSPGDVGGDGQVQSQSGGTRTARATPIQSYANCYSSRSRADRDSKPTRPKLAGTWRGSFKLNQDGLNGRYSGAVVEIELQAEQSDAGHFRGSFVHAGFNRRSNAFIPWGSRGSVTGQIVGETVSMRFLPTYVPHGTTLAAASYEGTLRGSAISGSQRGDHGGHGVFRIEKSNQ